MYSDIINLDGVALDSNNSIIFTSDENITHETVVDVRIESVKDTDAGVYECIANTDRSTADSQVIVRVKGK